jgi:NADPH-dependent 2,4-dienoyl-CoA reductase/sulfur reductase-like enzyme/rhodanese-related sulfurtransferase
MDRRIVVVGGVAGGMSAAARARRMNERAEIVVLEKSGHISFANCGLPYYLAGTIEREEALLLNTPAGVAARFRIDARVYHEVTRIDRERHLVEGLDHRSNTPFAIPYDKLILAPGAEPILPNIPGINAKNVFSLRNIEDTRRIQQFLDFEGPSRAVVVGAGFIGLEMVEALHARDIAVTLVEKASHVLPALDAEMSGWLEAELRRHGVEVRTGTGLSALEEGSDRVTAVVTENGERVVTDLVLLSLGVRPNLGLARSADLTVGTAGGIAADESCRTNDEDIYAVGDAAEVTHCVTGKAARIPLAGAANRHGRIAGEHAATGHSSKRGSVAGTAIVRVFGLDVGMTGLSLRAALAAGFDADTAIVHPKHHAGYFPGAQPIHLELVYEKSSRKVLGAQAIGAAGIDKRIDVVATLLHFGGSVDDLSELDLSYAPQFSSAKDPVHFAAFVAQNQLDGLSPGVDAVVSSGTTREASPQLLDVRTMREVERGGLQDAVNIPLDELRQRISELDPNRPVVAYCQIGVRGHIATRILLANGFSDVRNLKGGYTQAALRVEPR